MVKQVSAGCKENHFYSLPFEDLHKVMSRFRKAYQDFELKISLKKT